MAREGYPGSPGGRARADRRAPVRRGRAVPLQTAEKALKAFLAWHDRPIRKTHDLVEIDESLEPVLRQAAPLTEYAWKFRYPGGAEEPPVQEARAALGLACEVHRYVLDRIPGEVRP